MPKPSGRGPSKRGAKKRSQRKPTHRSVRSRLRREHLKSSGLSAAAFALAARARPVVGLQKIKFVISWAGGTAALDHLTYNTLLVDELPQYATSNRITVEFERPREAVHLFEWTLLFPNKELTNLEASSTSAIGRADLAFI